MNTPTRVPRTNGGSMSIPDWFSEFPELDEPVTDYLGELAAKNDALFARLHDEHEAEIEIDAEGVDRWLAQAATEYDVEVSL